MKKQITVIAFSAFLVFILFACKNSDSDKTVNRVNTAVSPEVKSVFINGDSLHYIDIGKGEPVIFVHGTLDDYRLWNMQMDTFAKKSPGDRL
jgi:hypothetical protein